MADSTCGIIDDGEVCGKPVKARGWCDKHWKRWKTNGDPHIAGRRGHAKSPEAEAERRRKIAESGRGKKYGPPNEETRRKLSVAQTGRKASQETRDAMSAGHLANRDKIAATSLAQWEKWRAEHNLAAPGYFGLHNRVRKARGPASNYACVDCEKRAQHWATLHGTDGTDVMAHYQPMCVPCHFAYDQVAAQAKATLGPEGRRAAALKAWETKHRGEGPASDSPPLPLAGP